LEALVVDITRGDDQRARVDIVDRQLSDDAVRTEGIRYILAIACVLAIVTFTLVSMTLFYSGGI
jgi:hypothetical protein